MAWRRKSVSWFRLLPTRLGVGRRAVTAASPAAVSSTATTSRSAYRTGQMAVAAGSQVDAEGDNRLSRTARWVRYGLLLAIVAIQYPLWLGKGSWSRVWDYSLQIEREKELTRSRQVRNAGMEEEITNMRDGRFDAIEERARFDLLMVKPGEIFVATPERKQYHSP